MNRVKAKMKFEKKSITYNIFIQYIDQPYSCVSIIRKDTGDVMQYAGRLQNTDKFVFKNQTRNVYSEYTMKEIIEKLYVEIPTLEIGDWFAEWQPSGMFKHKYVQTKTDCDKYNFYRNWRQLTQAEWERLLKPIFSSLPQSTVKLSSTPLFPSPNLEESIEILQKRVENTVSESVKKAITKYGRNMKHLGKHFIK